MNCADFQEGLLDYHFAVETQERREASRAHLRDCADCAQEYFDLKHDIDSGAAQGDRPSEAARDRLHGAVAAMVAPSLFARTRGWLQAPTPRYRTFAVMAAAAMAILLLRPGRTQLVPDDERVERVYRAEQAERPDTAIRSLEARYPRVQQVHAVPASIVDSARIDALSITYY